MTHPNSCKCHRYDFGVPCIGCLNASYEESTNVVSLLLLRKQEEDVEKMAEVFIKTGDFENLMLKGE